MKTKEDREYFDECERFLSYESISKIVLQTDGKRCCKKNCIQRISSNYEMCDFSESTEFVTIIRKKLLGRDRKERAVKMFDLLKGIENYNNYSNNYYSLSRMSQGISWTTAIEINVFVQTRRIQKQFSNKNLS